MLAFLIMYQNVPISSFGPEDEVYIRLKKMNEDLQESMGYGNPADFMPSLAYCPLLWPKMNKMKTLIAYMINIVRENITEHRQAMEKGRHVHQISTMYLNVEGKGSIEGWEYSCCNTCLLSEYENFCTIIA